MATNQLPIIYVRGYAGTQTDVEETVDDPFYGFNIGSTHIRQDQTGKAMFFAFQSPFVRLARNYGYTEVFDGPAVAWQLSRPLAILPPLQPKLRR